MGDNDDNRHSPRYLKQAPVGHGIFPAAFFCFGYYVEYQLHDLGARQLHNWMARERFTKLAIARCVISRDGILRLFFGSKKTSIIDCLQT
jgi:hypothetical protein